MGMNAIKGKTIMTEPLLSVISPVYNVERYISDYLHSILNQTYRNLEIICVDDGSPDMCGKILDEYAAKDARLHVLHQGNAGYTNATNLCLDNATGDYISFIDPDDWVELDYIQRMVGLAEETEADIVVSNFWREYDDRSERMRNAAAIPTIIADKNSAFRYGFEADVYSGFKMFVWNKLFRSKFFASRETSGLGFRMDPMLSTGADVLLSAMCILNADRIAYTQDALYHYRIREESLMRSTVFSRRLGLNTALERIIDMLEKEQLDDEVINLVKRFHTYYCSQLAEFAFSNGDAENLRFSKKQMEKYLGEYIVSNQQFPYRLERIHKIMEINC
jgi:glycosyltransferase involved in cell wall biosynthesis